MMETRDHLVQELGQKKEVKESVPLGSEHEPRLPDPRASTTVQDPLHAKFRTRTEDLRLVDDEHCEILKIAKEFNKEWTRNARKEKEDPTTQDHQGGE